MTETEPLRHIGRLYGDGQRRITELVSGLPGGFAKSTVAPACPEWSVHDVVAHVTGVADDITAGRVDGVATDAWTSTQVRQRRDWDTARVLAEWDEKAPAFAGMLDDFPGWFGVQALMDLTVHEHDLRGALDAPGFRDSEGLAGGLDLLLCAVLHPVASAQGLPPLEVRAGEQRWVIGGLTAPASEGGDPVAAALISGSRPPDTGVDADARLTVSAYELFRAATGRRSMEQIFGYDWNVDPEVYLPLFSCGPFHVRESALTE